MERSFPDLEYAVKKKVARRRRLFGEIEAVTPWRDLVAVLELFCPKGERGRPPIGVERMLRMYVAQQCSGLSGEGIEDALYDSQAIRRFVGLDLAREAAPDATNVLKSRDLLAEKDLTASIFSVINAHLSEKGLLMRQGTIVDATIIAAPTSSKNQDGERGPEMHQTRDRNQWYFGMTSRRRSTHEGRSHEAGCGHERSEAAQVAHIGVDAESGLVHTVGGTAAHVNDVTQAQALLSGEETEVYADTGSGGWRSAKRTRGFPSPGMRP